MGIEKLENRDGVVEFRLSDEEDQTKEMKTVFDHDGVFVIRGLLDADESGMLKQSLEMNNSVTSRAWDLPDGDGGTCRLVIWNQPGTDVTGMIARSDKVAGTCEKMLGGDIYHYHTKVMMKNAECGGKTLWHQDYGYWYKNGILRPDLMTVFIAVDKMVKANGCLQFLKGTNRCGRIVHDMVGGQTMANLERVEQLEKQFERVWVEMEPGDALFFHCNTLHMSDCNTSDMRRWAMTCSYNRSDNDAYKVHHHGNYVKLDQVPNSAIKSCTNFTDLSGKDFMDPTKDQTVKIVKDEDA